MACTLEQYIRSAIESSLLTADEMKSFLLKIPQAQRPTKAEQLAKELVLAGMLTKYQAAAIFQGKQKGLVLGQYAVLDQIGAGAMGQVFKAQHRGMKRIVAIKVLPASAMKSQDAVQRFQREMQAAARLLHQNIVAAYDADEAQGLPFLVLEFVDGVDLKSLYQQSALPVSKALDYIIQAARGLEFAHSQGVIHRDIKPANLLVDKHGTVKILDMGLARIHQELSVSEGLTRSGEIMGTVDYMSPEQAVNTHEADHRADMYSLGCTLYRLLTGNAVYDGESMMAKIVAHRRSPIPSLAAKRHDVSPELDAVFQKMIAKEPHDRYGSMTEVIAALERCRSGGKSPPVAVPRPMADDPQFQSFLSELAPAEPKPRTIPLPRPPAGASRGDVAVVAPPIIVSPSPPQSRAMPAQAPSRSPALPNLELRHWILIGSAIGGLVLLGLVALLVAGRFM